VDFVLLAVDPHGALGSDDDLWGSSDDEGDSDGEEDVYGRPRGGPGGHGGGEAKESEETKFGGGEEKFDGCGGGYEGRLSSRDRWGESKDGGRDYDDDDRFGRRPGKENNRRSSSAQRLASATGTKEKKLRRRRCRMPSDPAPLAEPEPLRGGVRGGLGGGGGGGGGVGSGGGGGGGWGWEALVRRSSTESGSGGILVEDLREARAAALEAVDGGGFRPMDVAALQGALPRYRMRLPPRLAPCSAAGHILTHLEVICDKLKKEKGVDMFEI